MNSECRLTIWMNAFYKKSNMNDWTNCSILNASLKMRLELPFLNGLVVQLSNLWPNFRSMPWKLQSMI